MIEVNANNTKNMSSNLVYGWYTIVFRPSNVQTSSSLFGANGIASDIKFAIFPASVLCSCGVKSRFVQVRITQVNDIFLYQKYSMWKNYKLEKYTLSKIYQ